MTPRFSVIVPVYNGEAHLDECLRRLCNQTVPRDEYEVIVVDDGSTDATPEIAAGHPVRLIRQENAGRVEARNRGAREARSGDLVFCDVRVFVEPDVFETMLGIDRRPLMFGSDNPDQQQSSLLGRFFFCVYRRLWKPYYPQEWYGDFVELNAGNFDATPKGTGFFVCGRDFWLRHQPERSDRHLSDDTLIFAGMVREKPIWRCSLLRCHYQQRTDLRAALPHLHGRGVLFNSYYLRPGRRFFRLYLALWAVLLALVFAAIAFPRFAWVIPVGAAGLWLGTAARWATSLRNFSACLLALPLVTVAFGSGVLRGHWIDLRRLLGRSERSGGRARSLLSWAVLAGVIALAAWYLKNNWEVVSALAALPWWAWFAAAGPLLGLGLLNGLVLARMVRPLGLRLRAPEWVSLAFMTHLGNLLGPSRAGLVLRSLYLRRRGLALSHFVSTLGGSYILATLAQTTLAAVGLIALALGGRPVPVALAVLVGVGLAASAALAVWAPPAPSWLERKVPPAASILRGWKRILGEPRVLRQVFACMLGNVVLGTVLFAFLFGMLGAEVPLGAVAVVYGIGGIAALLAVTPAALGFFDFAAVATGAAFGIPPETSAAAMLVYRGAELALALSLGTLGSMYLLRTYRRLPREQA